MPTAIVSLYLNDEDFVRYVKQKASCNEAAREAIKKMLKR